jgi:hypothetical protein
MICGGVSSLGLLDSVGQRDHAKTRCSSAEASHHAPESDELSPRLQCLRLTAGAGATTLSVAGVRVHSWAGRARLALVLRLELARQDHHFGRIRIWGGAGVQERQTRCDTSPFQPSYSPNSRRGPGQWARPRNNLTFSLQGSAVFGRSFHVVNWLTMV